MNIIRRKWFLGLFCVVSMYFSSQPILPETIATTTLLKCGGVAAVAAAGSRYITLATKEISQLYQMHFRKIPQAEYYDDFSSSNSETSNKNIQKSFLKKDAEKSLFTKITEIVPFKKKQQYQSQTLQADVANGSSDEQKTCWTQTNVHAQQARGFFPKINNYHYHSDTGDFWKGATIGSFVTGTTCFYLVVSHNKN